MLVEAAGVEPASEKVNRETTTCVSDSIFFVHPMRNRQEGDGLNSLKRIGVVFQDLAVIRTTRKQIWSWKSSFAHGIFLRQ